jgi:hypothetical protein
LRPTAARPRGEAANERPKSTPNEAACAPTTNDAGISNEEFMKPASFATRKAARRARPAQPPSPTMLRTKRGLLMLAFVKIGPRTRAMLFGVSASIPPGLPAQAGSGHRPWPDHVQIHEASTRQCERTNTYNDIEYAPC